MKPIFYIVFITLSLCSLNGNLAVADIVGKVSAVESVDLKRYMGTWYEIAKIPNRFQKNCIGNTTADYTLLNNGEVQVINTCLQEKGVSQTAKGIARVSDKETNAKLKVSFFSILGIHFFWGNYWILYIDDKYENVVVGEPERKYGWILSRKTDLTSKELEPIYKILTDNGYNPEDFEPTQQNITN